MNLPRRKLIQHGPFALTIRFYAQTAKPQSDRVSVRSRMLRIVGRRAWEWSQQHDTFRFKAKAEAQEVYDRLRSWAKRNKGYIREIDLAWAPAKTCPAPMAHGPGRKMIAAARIRRQSKVAA